MEMNLTRQEVIDLLPDQFLFSFGGENKTDNRYFIRKTQTATWKCASEEHFVRHGFRNSGTVDASSIARWLLSGDLIEGVTLYQYINKTNKPIKVDANDILTLL